MIPYMDFIMQPTYLLIYIYDIYIQYTLIHIYIL